MEELKSFRINIDCADTEGKKIQKEITVKVNTPKLKDKSSVGYKYPTIYTLSFTIQIPDYIHSYLIGKSVPTRDGETAYKEDFAKSITNDNLESLTKRFCNLIDDYVWLKQIEKAELKKVIFYSIAERISTFSSSWNSAKFGKNADLHYKYAIGYVSSNKGVETRYNSEKKSVNTYYDKSFYQYKYVAWTQEREDFFENIQQSFANLAEKISAFDSKIEDSTIDSMITKTTFLSIN